MDKKNPKDEKVNSSEAETDAVPTEETAQENGQSDTEGTDNQSTEPDQLEKIQTEHSELKDKYIRLLAEFENYKKRNTRERIELMSTAAQDTLTALLPVLDDFDRAMQLPEEQRTTMAFTEGIQLVYQKLNNILGQRGLEAMESTGEPFDPELYEALTEIPAPAEDLKGKVVDTIERGYTLKGKIIRHAKVVVGK